MVKPRGKLVRDCDVTSRDLPFRSVWRELKGQGWTSKRPPRRSLDGRYLYVRPGGDPDGTAGVDFFLGEGAVLEYYANILRTRARTPRPSDLGDAELERAARVVEETYGHLIEGSPAHGQAAAGANPRGPSLSVTSARQTSSLQLASGQVPPALRAQGPPHSARAHVPAATGVAQAPPTALRSQGRPPAAHTQGLATADDDHGPPLAARLEGQPRAARGQDQRRALRSQGRSGAAHVQLPSAADGHGPPHAQAQTRAARVQMPAMTPCGQGPPATVCAQGSSSTARAGLNRERGASRPTRRMLVCTDSPMTTPPRRISTSTPLCTTSPHVHDESADSCDDAATSDGTLQLDGASVHSAEDASGSDIDTCEEDEGEVDPLSTELLADNDDDLNAVGDGEDADDYGAMESGDDAEKDDLEAGEDDEDGDCDRAAYESERDEVEPTESEIAAEVLFAEDFLSRFGGEDAVLAGNLKNDVLREMSASGWENVEEPDTYDYMQTPYDPVSNTQSYPGLRQGYSGPTPEALRNADSPLALFFFFMPVASCIYSSASFGPPICTRLTLSA